MIVNNMVYIIDEDKMSQTIIERLIKNEFGSLTIKTFNSCESSLTYIKQQMFYAVKEYPNKIILSNNFPVKCILEFLKEVKGLATKNEKNINVYLLVDANSEIAKVYENAPLELKGYIFKPIKPNELIRAVQPLKANAV